jgi:hypothetical protein
MGRGRGTVGTFHTKVARIATLSEFDENCRFFTTYIDPNMGHTLKTVFLISFEKGQKGWFFRKMPEVRI